MRNQNQIVMEDSSKEEVALREGILDILGRSEKKWVAPPDILEALLREDQVSFLVRTLFDKVLANMLMRYEIVERQWYGVWEVSLSENENPEGRLSLPVAPEVSVVSYRVPLAA